MVGGTVFRVEPGQRGAARLLVRDATYGDRCTVEANDAGHGLPIVSDSVWWQSGKIYFDHDKKHAEKVGNSFALPEIGAAQEGE